MRLRFAVALLIALVLTDQTAQSHQQEPQQHDGGAARSVAPIQAVVPRPPSQIATISADGGPQEENQNYLCRAFSADFLSNWALVLVGLFGVWAALSTLGTIKRQVDEMEKEFIATHRPKLVVREVRLAPKIEGGKNIVINYVVSNAGSSEGRIVEFFFEAQYTPFGIIEPLRRDLNLTSPNDSSVNELSQIKPGAFIEMEYASPITHETVFPKIGVIDINPETLRFLFRGRFIYADKSGVHRQTTFCRYYDFEARRFRRLNDPDLEYED